MNTIDPQELQKFSAMASQWWDPQGYCRPLHEINPLRLRFVMDHAVLAGKRVLDVGCGGGILAEALAASGATAMAIDLAKELIEVAKLHLYESKQVVDYRCLAVEALAEQEPHSFDVVTCMEMLEHVPDPTAIMQACAKLLKPGGDLFVSTLDRSPKAFVHAIVGAEYVLGLLPKGTHQYERFIKPSELISWARAYELSCLHSAGIDYHPVKRRYSLTNQIQVNYLLHFQKETLS